MFEVISDNHSNHNLPIGAHVEELAEAPNAFQAWYSPDVRWYTLGIVGDEVAIDPRDLKEIR